MAADTVDIILKAEAEAAEKVAAAGRTAEKLLADAKAEGEARRAERMADAEERAAATVDAAKAKCESAAAFAGSADADDTARLAEARKHFDTAADAVVDAVLNG